MGKTCLAYCRLTDREEGIGGCFSAPCLGGEFGEVLRVSGVFVDIWARDNFWRKTEMALVVICGLGICTGRRGGVLGIKSRPLCKPADGSGQEDRLDSAGRDAGATAAAWDQA